MASKKVLTLAFISKGEDLLLGMKKRGLGEGRWNGFGGKVHSGKKVAPNFTVKKADPAPTSVKF
jgi:8-oxo-dGTP diphosphatase/2-hydroxy-dATP diphosphatase